MLKGYIDLTKPKIIILLLITALGGLFLATEGIPNILVMLVVLIGGSLGAGGANAINHYLDRDIDEKMGRTKERPIVSGQITPKHALIFGISLNVLAFIVLWQGANLLSAILTIIATLIYVFVYTIGLKRTTPQNIVIGGAAGSIPPMVGWAAVTGNIIDPAPWLLFLIIFFWTPPHFWALALLIKDDYAKAEIPMLPVVKGIKNTKIQIFAYTWILLALIIASTYFISALSILFGVVGTISTLTFSFMAWQLISSEGITKAKKVYLFSLLYLALIFVIIMIDGLA
ncbi:MAG: protoheme IX farnesyltransferase [Chloroflexi bacterium]|nr:protoheme IX farnesyltransferase [Chloroflexota bacterium]|tara:strand:- start:2723 stop:3580 length:858 start_codon:yes stop_codon:yes gene_type:complete